MKLTKKHVGLRVRVVSSAGAGNEATGRVTGIHRTEDLVPQRYFVLAQGLAVRCYSADAWRVAEVLPS